MNGIVNSINYPDEYFPLYTCTYYISVPSGYHVALTFIDLDLQSTVQVDCVDYLTIETSDHNDVILCGDIAKLPSLKLYYETLSNWMVLRFYSDYLIQGRGFKARFSAVQLCLNQTYSIENGTFTSVNYPQPYLNRQECFFTIILDNPSKVVDLQFLEFNTEARLPTYMQDEDCDRDYVALYDGSAWHRICGDWSGREYQLRFVSKRNVMVVKFVSDAFISAPGFKATWRSLPSNVSAIECPKQWTSFVDTCVQVQRSPKTWQEAQEDCQRYQSHLIFITTAAKQKFIQDLILRHLSLF